MRTWLIAYGIGAPVLFLSNEHIWKAVIGSKAVPWIAITLLAGVVVQIVLAMFDKWADWICFYKLANPSAPPKRQQDCAKWWIDHDWPTILADLATFACFAFATVVTFIVLTNTAPGATKGSEDSKPLVSGELISVTLWSKPVQRPGEVGQNTGFSPPPGSSVDVFDNFIVVTEASGIRHVSLHGWYCELRFRPKR